MLGIEEQRKGEHNVESRVARSSGESETQTKSGRKERWPYGFRILEGFGIVGNPTQCAA